MTQSMLKSSARFWWLPMLTGLLAVALGIWCLAAPQESLPVMAYAFSLVLCCIGFMNVVFGLVNIGSVTGWGYKLVLGIIEIVCGVWMLCLPQASLVSTFIFGIGFYLVFVALCAVSETILYYGNTRYWMMMLLSFIVCTLILAVIFLAGPIAGGIAVWLYLGIAFISFGIYRILISCQIYKANKEFKRI